MKLKKYIYILEKEKIMTENSIIYTEWLKIIMVKEDER